MDLETGVVDTAVAGVAADNDESYEFVDGQRMEPTPMGVNQIGLANDLLIFFALHFLEHPLGKAFVEMLYRLRKKPRLDLKPDLSYVPFERWPERIIPDAEAWEMIPALVVEIISKTNGAEEIQVKLGKYFACGVSLVWVIFPQQRQIVVYDGLKNIRLLDDADTLDGGRVLPDFRLPVAELLGPAPASQN